MSNIVEDSDTESQTIRNTFAKRSRRLRTRCGLVFSACKSCQERILDRMDRMDRMDRIREEGIWTESLSASILCILTIRDFLDTPTALLASRERRKLVQFGSSS